MCTYVCTQVRRHAHMPLVARFGTVALLPLIRLVCGRVVAVTTREGRATVVAVVQQKGGTGKTTTVATLGDVLQRKCSRTVLLVDLDPQASLTEWLTTPDDPV